MYGAIGRSIWNKEYWGEQSDDFQSNLFSDNTLKNLEKVAREHHPILQTIQERERDAEQLYSYYPLKEGDDDPDPTFGYSRTLEHQLKQECQENGEDTEWANRLRAAIGWRENSDEIKKLEEELQEARNAMYHAQQGKSDEERETYTLNRQKSYEAERSLKFTKQGAIQKYTPWSWHKNYYDFTSDFETFLSDIVFHRRTFREQLYSDEQIKELIQKYLENPSWHVPQITDFLLTDLIDSDLLRLDGEFQFGLFSPEISNQNRGPNNQFFREAGFTIGETSPFLTPESKKRRSKWRFRKFLIGAVLIFSFMFFSEEITKSIEGMGFPSWISSIFFGMLGVIGGLFIISIFLGFVVEKIYKRSIDIKSLHIKAHTLLNIRWDIFSGIYDAKTCIERLKRIDQPLHISSLVEGCA